MSKENLNEALMEAVSAFDLEAVKACLIKGADANYRRFSDEEEPDGLIQPTTPLRMVMFRISDCMLEDKDLEQFEMISEVLLEFGADPGPAMEIAESRYGTYRPDIEINPFTKVWHLIAKALH
jgi:hypothetical protein